LDLKKPIINQKLSKEQAILYYLFIDEQLMCAWWDYLEIWDDVKENKLAESTEFRDKMMQTMKAVEYWEEIIDQLKKIVSYEDIEDYIKKNPQIKKSYLFVR
tara:strand:+ start:1984 stop:2289 length:306 start_codon:yes stop_codon:yes gene_type:complete